MNLDAPSKADIERLAQQMICARQLVRGRAREAVLDGSTRDLAALQAVLDSGALAASDTEALQALGAAFGAVLIGVFPGLDWAIITDEYGRDATIRYQEMSITLNVIDMICRRIEDGEAVDLTALMDLLVQRLPGLISEAGYSEN